MNEEQLHRINDLTIRSINGTLTPEEKAEFDEWLDLAPQNRQRLQQRIDAANALPAIGAQKKAEQISESGLAKILSGHRRIPSISRLPKSGWLWKAASIAALLLIGGAALFYNRIDKPGLTMASNTRKVPVPPGGNKALLELADGRKIDLTGVSKGTLSHQGNSSVVKEDSGKISYVPLINNTLSKSVSYNTVSTPRGGTYQVELPDHSLVWLNAASSLRFPTAFTGSKRQVELTGEAYFEVAKNKAAPFMVTGDGINVMVLGTAFNVNNYSDEKAPRISLVSGSIAVKKDASTVILQPGQQAIVKEKIDIQKVDVDEAIAWKNGYFLFNGADLETAMRDIGRWYNVDVVFNGVKNAAKMTARVSRSKSAEDVLEILQAGGYHVSISTDGKTMTVLP